MALCLATSLVECGGFDAADQMRRYLRWCDEGYLSSTGTCFDIGNTVHDALDRFADTGEPFSGNTAADTAGNGSVMRLAPAVLHGWPDLDSVRQLARESSRTTHGAPECLDACELMAVLMHRALSGATKGEILSPVPLENPSDGMRAIADMAFTDKHVDDIVGSGYVVESLEAALWCFARNDTFESAILAAANLGHDADTTAAICGQLAGAHHGLGGIPDHWVERVAMRESIVALADALAEMTDRALAGEEVVVLRGTRPVARFVPVEPRVPKRLGTLNDLLSDEEMHDLDEVVATSWSDTDRAVLAGEATDDLGIWKGRPQADGA